MVGNPRGLTRLVVVYHPDLRFQFRTTEACTEALERVNAAVKRAREVSPTPRSVSLSGSSTPSLSDSSTPPPSTPTRSMTGLFSPLSRTLAVVQQAGVSRAFKATRPKAINIPGQFLVKSKSKHFVCPTIGSHGDVQPYIALGLGLMKEGHTVTIVTHDEYKCSSMLGNRVKAEVLSESPSAMAGVHIAEALNIPYFRTLTMPWTKTSEFPHAFLSPPFDAPTFNAASYVLFNSVMWTATSGQINRWRRNTLQIGNTDNNHLDLAKITFGYNFSSAVVPKLLDWGDAITVSGYWFSDNPEGANWTPPQDSVDWMAKARSDGKPIVYIGFGSITVPHPNRVTARIVMAVLKSGVRAIISKGWSARMSKANDKDPEVEIPEKCYVVNSVPHDWLFQRIDAAMHHGGAGTTGASLRAGIPTLIKPWFGDQYFWARVG
ncbi:glycosyltransferase family 1 protein [Mycena leptocephala]|nr:glycosyltransferase family 1 protein [Mycena leptocephala]